MEISERTEKDKFIKIFYTVAESCEPELLKESIIYVLYK